MSANQATIFLLLVLCGVGPASGVGLLLVYRLWWYWRDGQWVIWIGRGWQEPQEPREKQ